MEAEAGALASISVFGILTDVLDGHRMPIFSGVEHDDAPGSSGQTDFAAGFRTASC
jgi:hypothetical protein